MSTPSSSYLPLRGRTALVTGGSRGIGRAIALKLARHGAQVALLYAGNTQAAEETLAQLEAIGREISASLPVAATGAASAADASPGTAAHDEATHDEAAALPRYAAYRCDVADYDAVAQTVEQVGAELGRVDILVNNAGITRDQLILKMSLAEFDDVIDTNLKGAFHLIKACMRHLMKSSCGRVINIASVIGITGNVGQANYAAAKAGILGLTKSVARELAGKKVTCNAIAPGYIETDMTGALDELARQSILSDIPLKKPGSPDDIAAAAAFLASDDAAYITGEVLRVDGGMCM